MTGSQGKTHQSRERKPPLKMKLSPGWRSIVLDRYNSGRIPPRRPQLRICPALHEASRLRGATFIVGRTQDPRFPSFTLKVLVTS